MSSTSINRCHSWSRATVKFHRVRAVTQFQLIQAQKDLSLIYPSLIYKIFLLSNDTHHKIEENLMQATHMFSSKAKRCWVTTSCFSTKAKQSNYSEGHFSYLALTKMLLMWKTDSLSDIRCLASSLLSASDFPFLLTASCSQSSGSRLHLEQMNCVLKRT